MGFLRACLSILLALWGVEAHAQKHTATDRVIVPDGSGEYEIPVHPATATLLYFPDDLQSVNVSDATGFRVDAKGHVLRVRPAATLAIGTQASIGAVTPTMQISLLVRVVAHGRDAALQRTFVHGTRTPPAPAPAPPSPYTTARPRWFMQLGGSLGQTWMRDAAGHDPPLVLSTLSARAGYRGSRIHAYELAVHIGRTEIVHEDGVLVGSRMAESDRLTVLARAEVGASLRLPGRWTPIIRLAAGLQRRTLAARIRMPDGHVYDHPTEDARYEATGSAGIGVDYRVHSAWSVGLELCAVYGRPRRADAQFASLEGGIHVHWN